MLYEYLGTMWHSNSKKVLEQEKVRESFVNLRAKGGFDLQIEFLQNNVIAPILNRRIYRNCAQLVEKVPRGVVLYGENREGITSLTQSLVQELRIQDKRIWRYMKRYEKEHRLNIENVYNIRRLFEEASASDKPALVFLHDVHKLYNYKDRDTLAPSRVLVDTLMLETTKTTPGEVFVVVGIDKLPTDRSLENMFTHFLRVPEYLTTEMRKDLLISLTSKWGRKPSDDILNNIAKRTSVLLSRKSEIKEDINDICTTAYRRCVERYTNSIGNSMTKKIDASNIYPTIEDWEVALNFVLSRTENVVSTNFESTTSTPTPTLPTNNIKPNISEEEDIDMELAKGFEFLEFK